MKTLYGISTLAFTLALSACVNSTSSSSSQAAVPDMCLYGGTIYTGHGAESFTGNVLVKDGVITKLTKGANCQGYMSAKTETINLQGSFIYPGFVDAHGHFLGIGLRELTLNLEGTTSHSPPQTTARP